MQRLSTVQLRGAPHSLAQFDVLTELPPEPFSRFASGWHGACATQSMRVGVYCRPGSLQDRYDTWATAPRQIAGQLRNRCSEACALAIVCAIGERFSFILTVCSGETPPCGRKGNYGTLAAVELEGQESYISRARDQHLSWDGLDADGLLRNADTAVPGKSRPSHYRSISEMTSARYLACN